MEANLNQPNLQFDYIFAGGGMAALSLAYQINNSNLKSKKILILDQSLKNSNDHTWCFWENDSGTFEEIVFRKWNGFWFHGNFNFSKFLKLEQYQYKMIRSIDFYDFIIPELKLNPNITFKQVKAVSIANNSVKTETNEYFSNEYIFDSISIPKFDKPQYNNLLQHFLGWVIETNSLIFEKDKPTLFDFRVDQKNECRFVYVLPFSEKKALVEFTIFSDNLIEKKEYELELSNYLKIHYGLNSDQYTIKETEFGIIPMSDESIDLLDMSGIIKIGTAAGFVKPSTGYSFQRTQNYCQQLVKALENKSLDNQTLRKSTWKKYLDSVLLNVMKYKRAPQSEIFTSLFSKNKADSIFKFLSEESTLFEDIKLMNSVPKLPFIKSAIDEFLKRIVCNFVKK
ncbi:MAG: lycopene cyclase family protein [Bacteroidota bacterium]